MNRGKTILCIVALAMMLGGAGLILRLQASQQLGKPGVLTSRAASPEQIACDVLLPANVFNFEAVPAEITEQERGTLPKDTSFGRRIYRAPDGFQAQMSVVLMGTDRTSIHKPQFCLTGQGWVIEKTERDTIAMERPRPYALPVLKLTAGKQFQQGGQMVSARGLYVYWFVADGQITTSDGERMWSMARELMRTGTLQRWAYVACFAVCAPGQEEETYRRLKELIVATVPEFQLATGSGAAAETRAASQP